MGGKAFEIIYEDDQFKPDVGKQSQARQRDRVNFVIIHLVDVLARSRP
jgi:branched-chain amino acid transport system substrate-binding protein